MCQDFLQDVTISKKVRLPYFIESEYIAYRAIGHWKSDRIGFYLIWRWREKDFIYKYTLDGSVEIIDKA